MASKVILGDELLFPSKYLCQADRLAAYDRKQKSA
jgi:hypothetical protein